MVSIIVPVFNVEKHLIKCLESIVNQTYTDLEIILVDDGSQDSCGEICDAYAKKDSRIIVIHKENGGLGFARNSGLDVCTGEYIMFVDSDAYLSENAVQLLLDRILADGSDMAMGKHIDVYKDGTSNDNYWKFKRNCLVSREEFFSLMDKENYIPVCAWGKLYKREIFNDIRYTNIRIGEDLWVFPYVVAQCKKISIDANTVYHYFQRSNSLIHKTDDHSMKALVEARVHTAEYLYKNGHFAGAYNYYSASINAAFTIKKRADRLGMFRKYFDRKTRILLLKGTKTKTNIKWYLMHFPFVCHLLRMRKR